MTAEKRKFFSTGAHYHVTTSRHYGLKTRQAVNDAHVPVSAAVIRQYQGCCNVPSKDH